MSAMGVLARGMIRRQAIGLVVLGLLAGLGLGVAMAAAADARSADSAYGRLRSASLAPDALFDGSDLQDGDVTRLAALPGVIGIARFSYTPVAPSPLVPGVNGGAFVGFDPDFLLRVYRPVVLRGRLPDPAATDEVVVNEAMARAGDLHVGQRARLLSGFEDPVDIGAATVVGVVRGIFDVGANAGNPSMLLGRSFLDAHRGEVQLGPQPAVVVRLTSGEAGLSDFERQASSMVGHEINVQFSGTEEALPTERTLRVQAVGLAVLALVAAAATIAAAIQAFNRLLHRALVDLPILVSVGVKPRQRLVLGLLLSLPVAAVGAAVSAGALVGASPLLPTGFARKVDPARGLRLDLTVLSLGVVIWGLVVGGAAVGLAWRLGRRPSEGTSVSGRVRRLLAALPYRARLGCESALVPLRSVGGAAARAAVVTAILSVTGVVALSTFETSLTRLLDTPRLQGWSFDAAIVNGDVGLDDLRRSLADLPRDPAVDQVAWVTLADLSISGTPVEAYAFDVTGDLVHPTMRFGRAPVTDGEIVLGADLLRGGRLSIGDRVEVSGPTGTVPLLIVGSATYPEIGNNSDLGTAASLTRGAARRVGAHEHGGAALVRLEPGHPASALDRFSQTAEVVTPFRPSRVRNLEQVGALPWVLGSFASILGVLAVGHGLWSSIHARRRDLAVLASIGLRPRDIRTILLWQVACLATVGSVVGGVAGIVLGSRAWSAVASATAVVDEPLLPLLAVGLIGAGAFVACGTVGFLGGRWLQLRAIVVGLQEE